MLFYVKNWIFVHITDKICTVTGPHSQTLAPPPNCRC